MQIDGITFLAQIINLAILVWLMKKFLYQPLLKAVEARQKQIDETNRKKACKRQNAGIYYRLLSLYTFFH